jgi:alkylhydroperoxidase family enzyme
MAVLEPLPARSIDDPELLAALERSQASGFPGSWLVRLAARVPGHGASLVRMLDAIRERGTLPERLHHLAGALLADRAKCPLYVDLHAQRLAADHGIDRDALAEILLSYDDVEGLGDRERLALRFVEQVVLDAGKVDEECYAELNATFTEAEIVELGTLVGVLYGLYYLLGTLAADRS